MKVIIPPFDPMDLDVGLVAAVKQLLHEGHGAGDESGPYDSDCPCRDADKQAECEATGCGFCVCKRPARCRNECQPGCCEEGTCGDES